MKEVARKIKLKEKSAAAAVLWAKKNGSKKKEDLDLDMNDIPLRDTDSEMEANKDVLVNIERSPAGKSINYEFLKQRSGSQSFNFQKNNINRSKMVTNTTKK